MQRLPQDERASEEFMLDLDEIARRGARWMPAEALEAEAEFYIEAARGERDERGHALVTRTATPGSGKSSWEPGSVGQGSQGQ
jgi:hypothetical protein